MLMMVAGMTLCHAQAPNWVWAQGAGGANFENGLSVATDAAGNVYSVGGFGSPSITFGSYTLTNSGLINMFIVKYNPSGTVLWAKSALVSDFASASAVTVDASGNIYVAGSFGNTTVTIGSTTLTSVGSRDIFLAKYDSNGNVIWAKRAGGSGTDFVNSVATDASGNIVISGYFTGTSCVFGTTTLSNINTYNMYVVKYSTSGTVIWAKDGSSNFDGVSYSVSVNTSGIYITGYFTSDNATFGAYTINNAAPAGTGTADIFIVKYDASGNVVWARAIGGADDEGGSALTATSSSLFITGAFYGSSISFGSINITGSLGDVFVTEYDLNGNAIWAKSEGGIDDEEPYAICTDGSGVYVTGTYYSPSIQFGSSVITNTSASVFVFKFDTSGQELWATSAGGNSTDEGFGIAASSNSIYVTGSFYSSAMIFGTDTLLSSGSPDEFIAKLNSTTGIADLENTQSTITLYPNPTSGIFTIESTSAKLSSIKIMNVLGECVYQSEIRNSKSEIILTGVSKGIYFLQANTAAGIMNKKIMVE